MFTKTELEAAFYAGMTHDAIVDSLDFETWFNNLLKTKIQNSHSSDLGSTREIDEIIKEFHKH